MKPRRRLSPLVVYCALLVVFLFAPVLTIIVFSFDEAGVGTFPLQGFTTRWYRELADSDLFLDAARNTTVVALATAAIAVPLGTAFAFALARYPVRLSPVFLALVVMPILLPGLLLGVSLLSFFDTVNVPLSLATVTIGHVLVTLPLVVLVMGARLTGFDRSVEDAAHDLGASPFQAFRHVTFPLIRASVIGSALLVLAFSIDEFIVTFFILGAENTLPVVIWGQMRVGVSPVVNAISSIMLAATIVLVLVVRRFTDVRFR